MSAIMPDIEVALVAAAVAYQIRTPIASPLEGDPDSPACRALLQLLHRGPSCADRADLPDGAIA